MMVKDLFFDDRQMLKLQLTLLLTAVVCYLLSATQSPESAANTLRMTLWLSSPTELSQMGKVCLTQLKAHDKHP